MSSRGINLTHGSKNNTSMNLLHKSCWHTTIKRDWDKQKSHNALRANKRTKIATTSHLTPYQHCHRLVQSFIEKYQRLSNFSSMFGVAQVARTVRLPGNVWWRWTSMLLNGVRLHGAPRWVVLGVAHDVHVVGLLLKAQCCSWTTICCLRCCMTN